MTYSFPCRECNEQIYLDNTGILRPATDGDGDGKELNLTNEQISEVIRIQVKEVQTKRKDKIREVLGCSLCCVCNALPSYRISYALQGLTRLEAYCDKCFENVYQRNKDIPIREIAEAYGCIKFDNT